MLFIIASYKEKEDSIISCPLRTLSCAGSNRLWSACSRP